jgi:hypothetical protein
MATPAGGCAALGSNRLRLPEFQIRRWDDLARWTGLGLDLHFGTNLAQINGEDLIFLPSAASRVEVGDLKSSLENGCELELVSGQRLKCAFSRAEVKKFGHENMGNAFYQYYVNSLPGEIPVVKSSDIKNIFYVGSGSNAMSLHRAVEAKNVAGAFVPSEELTIGLEGATCDKSGNVWSWKVAREVDDGVYVLWANRGFWFFKVQK